MSQPKTSEIDLRQSPIGFYNMGLSYLDAADELARKHLDQTDRFRLAFEAPIRHLYAHAWELVLKACIFRQGMKPSSMKAEIGHSLTKAWDAVDKHQFAALDLHDATRTLVLGLDQYHPTKMYAYPVRGYRREVSIPYLKDASNRFRISRSEILRLFGD